MHVFAPRLRRVAGRNCSAIRAKGVPINVSVSVTSEFLRCSWRSRLSRYITLFIRRAQPTPQHRIRHVQDYRPHLFVDEDELGCADAGSGIGCIPCHVGCRPGAARVRGLCVGNRGSGHHGHCRGLGHDVCVPSLGISDHGVFQRGPGVGGAGASARWRPDDRLWPVARG